MHYGYNSFSKQGPSLPTILYDVPRAYNQGQLAHNRTTIIASATISAAVVILILALAAVFFTRRRHRKNSNFIEDVAARHRQASIRASLLDGDYLDEHGEILPIPHHDERSLAAHHQYASLVSTRSRRTFSSPASPTFAPSMSLMFSSPSQPSSQVRRVDHHRWEGGITNRHSTPEWSEGEFGRLPNASGYWSLPNPTSTGNITTSGSGSSDPLHHRWNSLPALTGSGTPLRLVPQLPAVRQNVPEELPVAAHPSVESSDIVGDTVPTPPRSRLRNATSSSSGSGTSTVSSSCSSQYAALLTALDGFLSTPSQAYTPTTSSPLSQSPAIAATPRPSTSSSRSSAGSVYSQSRSSVYDAALAASALDVDVGAGVDVRVVPASPTDSSLSLPRGPPDANS
ncbi:hypothetical protein HGRIS_001625 [Hohenbuehelia grisea]|uniref:Uncharacterized protein n=1 Tax=Hohenbuehelia grisea TaxID=104357 RepID=A0ABR3JI66_9AGAR